MGLAARLGKLFALKQGWEEEVAEEVEEKEVAEEDEVYDDVEEEKPKG